jgi:hypothetical protein
MTTFNQSTITGIQSNTGQSLQSLAYPNSPLVNNQYTISANNGLGIGQTQQSGITVMAPDGEAIITFHTDGRIETIGGTIQARDLTAVIKLMKRMMTDIANDEELSARFPYIKDAAHEWVMDELRK